MQVAASAIRKSVSYTIGLVEASLRMQPRYPGRNLKAPLKTCLEQI
ncbi:MAG: hypothetical protein WCL39_06425 [Armatimonadota bacterium]